jgi:hypothetical protein
MMVQREFYRHTRDCRCSVQVWWHILHHFTTFLAVRDEVDRVRSRGDGDEDGRCKAEDEDRRAARGGAHRGRMKICGVPKRNGVEKWPASAIEVRNRWWASDLERFWSDCIKKI